MIDLHETYICESRFDNAKVYYVFLEEEEDKYFVKWSFEGKEYNTENHAYWSKRSVSEALKKGRLYKDLTDTEQAISKNYVI